MKPKKPDWLRVKLPIGEEYRHVRNLVDKHSLHTICESGNCPNMGECWGAGTATFMILGDLCTRRCPFCDVAHGRPKPPDTAEPLNLATTIAALKLRYVVITSVDRDDLRDGGSRHFADCIRAVRAHSPATRIEVLVPDFRGRLDTALDILSGDPPDVLNHNLETVPRLYKHARPGADYANSLTLLKQFKARVPHVPTKSGLMLGLGETRDEVLSVMRDLAAHGVGILTLGQYLRPSPKHLPIVRYVPPAEFDEFRRAGEAMGFDHVEAGPLVRSSYHAADSVPSLAPLGV